MALQQIIHVIETSVTALTVCDTQELAGSLTGCFGLRDSYDGTVKTLTRVVSSEGLSGARKCTFAMTPSYGYLEKASVPHHMGLFMALLECPQDIAAGSPERNDLREQGESHSTF